MTRSKWFLHDGRVLEVRDRRIMTSFQIWIYEDDRPLHLYSVVRLVDATAGLAAGRDMLGLAMDKAGADVREGRIALNPPSPAVAAAS